jgi:exodeoxyribonuclease-3
MRGRERNAGWRIDYFLVSKDLEKNILEAEVFSEVEGSDHSPVMLEIKL